MREREGALTGERANGLNSKGDPLPVEVLNALNVDFQILVCREAVELRDKGGDEPGNLCHFKSAAAP